MIDEYNIKAVFDKHGIDNDELILDLNEHFDRFATAYMVGVDEQEKGFAVEASSYLYTALVQTRTGKDKDGNTLEDRIREIAEAYSIMAED